MTSHPNRIDTVSTHRTVHGNVDLATKVRAEISARKTTHVLLDVKFLIDNKNINEAYCLWQKIGEDE